MKHPFVFGVSYTIDPGGKSKYMYQYLNAYDYAQLSTRTDIQIHSVDIYDYNRSTKEVK